MAGEAGATGLTGGAAGVDAAAQSAAQSEQISDLISDFTPGAKEEGSEGTTSTEGQEGAEGQGEGAGAASAEGEGEGAAPAEGEEQGTQIEALQKQLGELTAKIAELQSGKPVTPASQQAPTPRIDEDNFFETDEEYNKSFEDKATMNKILAKVKVATAQRILENLPKVVTNMVKSQVEVQGKIKDFFSTNTDLVNHKQFVAFVANDLGGKNPSWTVDKLFTELGKEVRNRIGLKGQANRAGTTQSKPPASKGVFPPGKSGARQPTKKAEDLSQLQKEILDLIE